MGNAQSQSVLNSGGLLGNRVIYHKVCGEVGKTHCGEVAKTLG